MNWLDVLILVLIFTNMLKGYSLGLMLSLFNLLQVIISLFITRNYYMGVFEFIRGRELVYRGFKRVVYFFFRLIFYRKEELQPGFLENFMTPHLIDLVLIGFSILFVYKVSTIIIDILFSLFSFILDIRIFKKIDRYGGILFGFFKGVLTVLIINGILGPILREMPGLMLSEAFLESRILEILLIKTSLLEEGVVYEKTRYIIWNTFSFCRSFISTL